MRTAAALMLLCVVGACSQVAIQVAIYKPVIVVSRDRCILLPNSELLRALQVDASLGADALVSRYTEQFNKP